MNNTIYSVMKECRNFFPVKGAELRGRITIADGRIDPLHLLPGQWYIIDGSVMNDGLHNERDILDMDETFDGIAVPLAIPKAFMELCERIESWLKTNGDPSPFTSEKFGDYSYQKATTQTGNTVTWKDSFATELAIWRRLG